MIRSSIVGVCTKKPCNSKAFFCPFTFFISALPLQSKPKEAVTHLLLLTSYLLHKMEPKYKVNPLTGELQEYVFEYNGILALRNFTARVEDERLILHAADDVNFSILEALVSEVEINGVVYDNPTAAQEALTRLTFNQNRPVLLDKSLKDLILGAVQKVEGKGLSSNDFTNAYKQQLDALEDYDIELDESTTELKFKKGNNVVRRISLMFLDDEGTKLVYNRTSKTLELRDKRDNLLTSIPVSHFVSNIPTSIVVQNGKIKLMAGSEIIDENTISYNDLADKPELNYLPLNGGTVTGDINFNGDFLLFKDKTKIHVRDNGSIVFGNKSFNDLVIGEFKGIQLWGQGNDRVVLAGGGVKDISDFATTQSVKSSIDEIQIGGRNFLRETANFTLKDEHYFLQPNYNGNAGFVNETFRGNKVIKLIHNWQGFQCKTDLENRPTIISFWAKTTKPNINIYYIVGVSSVTFPDGDTLISDGQWHRYTIFGKNGIKLYNNGNQGFVEFNRTSGEHIEEVLVSSFKIEYGNKATDWSPAPEDLKCTFFKGRINVNNLNDEVNRETGVYSILNPGIGTYILLSFRGEGSTSQLEIFKPNWHHETRLQVRNSIDDSRYSGDFKDLGWYSDVYRPGIIRYDWDATKEHQNNTVFVNTSGYIELNQLENLSSMSFRKVFSNGSVEFRCSGKQIIYTGDNQFNGEDGSTAVVSIYENKCYIDIRNI